MKTIRLTQNKEAIVDDDIFEFVKDFKWFAHNRKQEGKFYASRNFPVKPRKQKIMHLHHCVIGYPINGLVVDHINGNPLDNRRENLRIVTWRENAQNRPDRRMGKTTSKYIGVYFDKRPGRQKRWFAEIQIKGKRKSLGCYSTQEEAGKAYQDAIHD